MSDDSIPPMIDLSAYAQVDLVVLHGIVEAQQSGGLPCYVGDLVGRTGLVEGVVQRAIQRLHHAEVIEAREERDYGTVGPQYWVVDSLTRDALERSGAWPVPEDLAVAIVNRLAEALSARAEGAEGEQRSRLLTAAQVVGGAAKDLGVEVTASVISKSMGLS